MNHKELISFIKKYSDPDCCDDMHCITRKNEPITLETVLSAYRFLNRDNQIVLIIDEQGMFGFVEVYPGSKEPVCWQEDVQWEMYEDLEGQDITVLDFLCEIFEEFKSN